MASLLDSWRGGDSNGVRRRAPLNVELANKAFATKKEQFVENSVPMDAVLKSTTKWTGTEIETRTTELATLLHAKILKV